MAPKGEVIEVPQHKETDPRVRRGFSWDAARKSVKTPLSPFMAKCLGSRGNTVQRK